MQEHRLNQQPADLRRALLGPAKPAVETLANGLVVGLPPSGVGAGLDRGDDTSEGVAVGLAEVALEDLREFEQVVERLNDLPWADAFATPDGEVSLDQGAVRGGDGRLGEDPLGGAEAPVSVTPESRGRGIGEALTREALAIASSLGARTVDLTSRPSRKAANRLYLRLGFQRRDTNVYRYSLTGPT